MENKKFRKVIVKDDNGNDVTRFVPMEVPECHVYGGYLKVKEAEIPETKEVLLDQMLDTIREIAKDDKFWIVKKTEDGQYTVGWKIEFPQMYTQEPVKVPAEVPIVVPVKDYKQRMVEEYWQLKERHEKLSKMCVYYEAGTLDFEPTCSLELLNEQLEAMGKYLHCLEVRAQIEGIAL